MTAREQWLHMYSTIRYAKRRFGFVPTSLQAFELNKVDLEFSYYCEDFYRSPNLPENYEICRRISFFEMLDFMRSEHRKDRKRDFLALARHERQVMAEGFKLP